MTFFGFIDFRFRPSIQVTEADIEDYFNTRILPLAQKANPGKTISLSEYRERIERILMARRGEQEMQGWLADARKHTTIEYRDEELKPQPQAPRLSRNEALVAKRLLIAAGAFLGFFLLLLPLRWSRCRRRGSTTTCGTK